MLNHSANLVAAIGQGNLNAATVQGAVVSVLMHLLVASLHNRDAAQYAAFFILHMLYGPINSHVDVATRNAIMNAIKLPTSHWNSCVTKFRRASPQCDPSHPTAYVGHNTVMNIDVGEVLDKAMSRELLHGTPALMQTWNTAQRANANLRLMTVSKNGEPPWSTIE